MIDVLRAGWLTTVQDLGRPGHGALGIVSGGALDPVGLSVANLLAGNDTGAAGLEIMLGAARLRFTTATRIALAGDGVLATIDGVPVHAWRSLPVRAGQTLWVAAGPQSRCAYLAVAGGIDVPPVFGSRGTDLGTGFGGLGGVPLRDGDRLRQRRAPRATRIAPDAPPWGVKPPQWSALTQAAMGPDRGGTAGAAEAAVAKIGAQAATLILRMMPGGEYESFDAAAHAAFWDAAWTIGPQSNRMGYRLAGPNLHVRNSIDLPSHAVLPGVVQVPPDGQPILLLADAQTTGGYPKLGVVIQADLWRLAYARPGAAVRFVACSPAAALAALADLQDYLARVARAVDGWRRDSARRATAVPPPARPAARKPASTSRTRKSRPGRHDARQ